jgi:hypothetical protein
MPAFESDFESDFESGAADVPDSAHRFRCHHPVVEGESTDDLITQALERS